MYARKDCQETPVPYIRTGNIIHQSDLNPFIAIYNRLVILTVRYIDGIIFIINKASIHATFVVVVVVHTYLVASIVLILDCLQPGKAKSCRDARYD